MATALIWIRRRPAARELTGAFLAFCWNLPSLLAVNVAAARFGWWTFDAHGGLILGMPVDLYLAWAWLWAIPSIAFPSARIGAVVAVAFLADLLVMPALSPTLRLSGTWLSGEVAALIAALIPAQLLARWTSRDEHLAARVVLQMSAFIGLVGVVIPVTIIDNTGARWSNPATWSSWRLGLTLQMLALPVVLGASAVQEFVTRGRGTPVPFDPPRHLVTTGLYAYVGNPMQMSSVLGLLLLGTALRNVWIACAGVMAHIYSAGLAGWDEDSDLQRRFGGAWNEYRRSVRRWWPTWRPWHARTAEATLYVSESCGMCSEVGMWFRCRKASALRIIAAEQHPSRRLTRITYVGDDGLTVSGIAAVGRALEHIHFGWALVGAILRLPVVCPLVQLLVDASGGGRRALPHAPVAEAATRLSTRPAEGRPRREQRGA